MKVLLFGATGMVGQGVLIECLNDSKVTSVTTIGRSKTGKQHPKLREIEHKNLWDYSSIEDQLTGFDACFFCLGVTSAGKTEEQYKRVTYDITEAAGKTLSRLNPNMTLVFISGKGTDSTGTSRIMWARVKGAAENILLSLPFKAAYMFRPGVIQPIHGVKSKTKMYAAFYAISAPIFPIFKLIFPKYFLTTVQIGQAMIKAVEKGAPKKILESWDIKLLSES
jgi:uncharacterized protein YbjT (DUF2867 family)